MELIDQHPTEEVIERYLFGALSEQDSDQLEEHLLICNSCIDTAEQLLSFVQSLRSTLSPKRHSKARAAGRDALLEL
jgi:anti-sigma factor ChrR (cupin superfamily)